MEEACIPESPVDKSHPTGNAHTGMSLSKKYTFIVLGYWDFRAYILKQLVLQSVKHLFIWLSPHSIYKFLKVFAQS